MRTRSITRRTFTRSLALGAAAAALPAGALLAVAGKRLKVGHTGITWGFKPTDAEQAIADVGSLGFAGYESFGNVLEFWDKQGGLKRLLDAAQVPLRSAYCTVNLTDPAKRADEIAKLVRWGRLIQAARASGLRSSFFMAGHPGIYRVHIIGSAWPSSKSPASATPWCGPGRRTSIPR